MSFNFSRGRESEPPIMLLKVDFPEPLIPTRPMTSPSCAVSETPSKAKNVLFLFLGLKHL